MTEFTLKLDDPHGFISTLRDLLGGDAAVAIAESWKLLARLRDASARAKAIREGQ